MIAGMVKRNTSEIEHFATLIMGELQDMRGETRVLEQKMEEGFYSLQSKMEEGFYAFRSELRDIKRDVSEVADKK